MHVERVKPRLQVDLNLQNFGIQGMFFVFSQSFTDKKLALKNKCTEKETNGSE